MQYRHCALKSRCAFVNSLTCRKYKTAQLDDSYWGARLSSGTKAQSEPSCLPDLLFVPKPAPKACFLKLSCLPVQIQPGKLHDPDIVFCVSIPLLGVICFDSGVSILCSLTPAR